MKKRILYIVWAALYVLCVGLGTFDAPTGAMKAAMVTIAVLFFVPPGFLLWDAKTQQDRKTVLTVRCISIASLLLTLVGIILFFIAGVTRSAATNILYEVLIFVSSPMVCGQYWLLSMFLWACLLCATFLNPQKKNS